MLDHTAERLITLQEPVISTLQPALVEKLTLTLITLTLITKWSCDGSSGQAQYKQRLNSCEDESTDYSNSDLFMISLVPVILTATTESEEIIVWKNESPSSPRHCRPSMQHKKETVDLILREKERMEIQIINLRPTRIICGTKNIIVTICNLQW